MHKSEIYHNSFKSHLLNYLLFVISILAFFSSTDMVRAEDTLVGVNPYVLLDTENDLDEIVKAVNKVSVRTDQKFNMLRLTTSGEKPKIEFNKRDYLKLNASQKKELMEKALTFIKDSGLGNRDKNRLITFLEDQDEGTAKQIRFLSSDTSVDIANSSLLIEPFSGIVGIFLGVVSLLTLISLTMTIPIDMMYLSMPFFYSFAHRSSEERPWYITFEAYSALRDNELNIRNGVHANYLGTYFKRRGVVVFIIALTFGFLVSNNIYRMIQLISDVITNIISSV